MTAYRSILAACWLLSSPLGAEAQNALAAWDNRCEECHGPADEFAGKYLWAIGDQLQGRHHVSDLRRFMGNHYVPGHLLDGLQSLLMQHASTTRRFEQLCGACHGDVQAFVHKSVAVKWGKLRGLESSVAVEEFLTTHQNLPAEDADFFTRMLTRVADHVHADQGTSE